jgi:hypothetical protein
VVVANSGRYNSPLLGKSLSLRFPKVPLRKFATRQVLEVLPSAYKLIFLQFLPLEDHQREGTFSCLLSVSLVDPLDAPLVL